MPRKYRGPRLAMLTILWFAGAACAYMVGEVILRFGGDDAWRWVLASSAIIGLGLFLVRLGTPESPRWLLSKGRGAEAEAIIKQVYGDDFSLKNLPEQDSQYKVTIWNLLYAEKWITEGPPERAMRPLGGRYKLTGLGAFTPIDPFG